MRDQANELKALESMLSDASAEPTKLSYALLKSVTRNFSRMIERGGFGAVYLVYTLFLIISQITIFHMLPH